MRFKVEGLVPLREGLVNVREGLEYLSKGLKYLIASAAVTGSVIPGVDSKIGLLEAGERSPKNMSMEHRYW